MSSMIGPYYFLVLGYHGTYIDYAFTQLLTEERAILWKRK